MADIVADIRPETRLAELVASGDGPGLVAFFHDLPPVEMAYTITRLDEPSQARMLSLVPPDLAAQLMEHLVDDQAADLIEQLTPSGAAAIVDEMDSDDQADILAELDDDDAEAILARMDPDEAEDARRLVRYEAETAGGVMITEFLAYGAEQVVQDVLSDLRDRADDYAGYDVQVLYAVDAGGRLRGVVRIRDLVLAPGARSLDGIMVPDPIHAGVRERVEDLEDVFDHHGFNALPVVDERGLLVGVVRRAAVEEARGERADRALMKVGGIITGEERRSMAVTARALRRLAYLVPNIFLMLLSISVIAAFEDLVLKEVVALAIFLPLVAGICGCAGNQAVAVSIRELSLGLAKTADVARVLVKELQVGVVLGVVLGALVFGLVFALRGDPWLALAVGGAMPLTALVSVSLGGTVPLLLRAMGIDPAMASGPIITTLIDFCGFLTVLGLAWLMLDLLRH